MAETGWQRKFEDPITLADGRLLVTQMDAREYISGLPKKEPTCRRGKSQCRH